MPAPSRDGLKWAVESGSWIPIWTREPDISVVKSLAAHHLQHILPAVDLTVTFLAEGTFNKVYEISPDPPYEFSEDESYVMRVSAPVDPFLKTSSEAATLEYVRRHTTIPVARVVAFDASADNELGFEWIIMEKVYGVPLEESWGEMSLEAKFKIAAEMAGFIAQLESLRFPVIGNLYFKDEKMAGRIPVANDSDFELGEMIHMDFFLYNRIQIDGPRGPFPNPASWLTALIETEIASLGLLLPRDHPDFDPETLVLDLCSEKNTILRNCHQLIRLLPLIFKSKRFEKEQYVLHHGDLNAGNILINPISLEITGVIDWELVSTYPLWVSRRPPKFMLGQDIKLVGPVHPTEIECLVPSLLPQGGSIDHYWFRRALNIEGMALRSYFDYMMRETRERLSATDKLKSEFEYHVSLLELAPQRHGHWVASVYRDRAAAQRASRRRRVQCAFIRVYEGLIGKR